MAIRSKLLVGLTACLLVASSCHGAEIDLSELLPDTGQAGEGDVDVVVAGGGGGLGEVAGRGGLGEPDVVVGGPGAGGEGGDFSEMAGSGGGSEPLDTTPPQVLSISPSDGERGVRSDAKIVIRFSEPMNRKQTSSSSELVGVPSTTEWDETGTELTIVPVQALAYGDDEAVAYSLRVDPLAMDLAGNALGEQSGATFYTSRRYTASLNAIDALTGYAIDSDDQPPAFADPTVGDALDQQMKGLLSFSLSDLLSDTQEVTRAELTVGQYVVRGDPDQLGSITLEQVEFSAMSQAWSASPKVSFGVVFSDLATPTAVVDVSSEVRAQLAEGADDVGRIQFRFAFEQAAYVNGTTDEVRLSAYKLDVSYLAP